MDGFRRMLPVGRQHSADHIPVSALQPKHGGVCNPAANVLCEIIASDIPQNVLDGITNPVRLRYSPKGGTMDGFRRMLPVGRHSIRRITSLYPPKRGGVCNPAANVLCEITASDIPQNVLDGITNPVRLRLMRCYPRLHFAPSSTRASRRFSTSADNLIASMVGSCFKLIYRYSIS